MADGIAFLPPFRRPNPIVILHGMYDTRANVVEYERAALCEGYPVHCATYPTITYSRSIEMSCRALSGVINRSRVRVARRVFREFLGDGGLDALRDFFLVSPDLFGYRDEGAIRLLELLPGVVREVATLLKDDDEVLQDSFSGRIRELEGDLAWKLEDSGFAGEREGDFAERLCRRAAGEIMDRLVPGAYVIGHSLGGFVSTVLAMNGIGDSGGDSGFDGGCGIKILTALASPVGCGLKSPIPWGYSDYPYSKLHMVLLRHFERSRMFQEMHPERILKYSNGREKVREYLGGAAQFVLEAIRPALFSFNPAMQDIQQGSEFMRRFVSGREIPDGLTMFSLYTPDDGICESDCCRIPADRPNLINMEVSVPITEKDLWDPFLIPSFLAHRKMTGFPREHGAEFLYQVRNSPKLAASLLDPSNYEGMRWYTLGILREQLENSGDFLLRDEYGGVVEKIREAALDRLPFIDGTSYEAWKLLRKLK